MNDSPYRVRGDPLKFGHSPSGQPTPQVFPEFPKILRGGVQIFECVIRGPPRPIRDKISATGPILQKKFRNFAENQRFLELRENPADQKFILDASHSSYKWTKFQPDRLIGRIN